MVRVGDLVFFTRVSSFNLGSTFVTLGTYFATQVDFTQTRRGLGGQGKDATFATYDGVVGRHTTLTRRLGLGGLGLYTHFSNSFHLRNRVTNAIQDKDMVRGGNWVHTHLYTCYRTTTRVTTIGVGVGLYLHNFIFANQNGRGYTRV